MEVQTREKDSIASDIRGIMQLVQCFLIYTQILLHFANPATAMELDQSFIFYLDRLMSDSEEVLENGQGFCL